MEKIKVGDIIEDNTIKIEVKTVDGNNFTAKIIKINKKDQNKMGPRFATYISPQKIYTFECHEIGEGMCLWEIPEEQMKRNSSQFLLYQWPDTGFSFDLDF